MKEIVSKEVAFIVGGTQDGFYSKKWKVMTNIPLEDKLKQPVYFFNQAVGETTCDVFNIWDEEYNPKSYSEEKCKKMDWGPMGIEQWASYGSIHVIERLTAKLNSTLYNQYLHNDWMNQKFRKQR